MTKNGYWKVAAVASCVSMGLYGTHVLAHSEHDKARFVAQSGKDAGDCGNRFRPCQTILYAQQQANKGDKILVASGQYPVTSPLELLSLDDAINPVFGGYSTIDNYQVQSAPQNMTTLVGVPVEYREIAELQGFNVIVDTKSLEFQNELARTEQQIAAQQSRQSDVSCVNGQAGQYSCSNVSLVSHVPISEFSATGANDIWGHHDLNTGIEYAILGLRDGVSVVSLEDPENPVVVGKVTQSSTTWRDIKVLQHFDETQNLWQSYAYVTADNTNDGLLILDLNSLPASFSVANTDRTDAAAHNVYISNVDYSTNIATHGEPGLHILGANNFSGSMRTYSLANPTAPSPSWNSPGSTAGLYTHDASSVLISDERANTQCANATAAGCNVILDFNESEIRLWDHSDINNARQLANVTYNGAAYVHSGWWSEDKNYIFVHDELDERNNNLNTTMYVFDISDLQNPVRAGTWVGPTTAIDHNGFVRGNRYYMSNYERGLTILDITDPTTPVTAGYFDSFPVSDSGSFSGAWGVYPYLKSGLILVSDIGGGLFVLRDETRTGSIGFAETSMDVNEGETANIVVESSFAGSTSVRYEVFSGSADSADFVLQDGTLNFEAGANQSQNIAFEALTDELPDELTENLFVRLWDPKNGASLADNYLLQINIPGVANSGSVSFAQSQITVLENQGSASVDINRIGGNDTAISVDYALISGNDDLTLSAGTLTWEQGDSSSRSVEFSVVNDDENETPETFQLQLSSDNQNLLGDTSVIEITVRDDDSNQAPIVEIEEDKSAGAGTFTRVEAQGSDPEGDNISWQWTQVSGPEVSLSNSRTPNLGFFMADGDVVLEATVSDDFGVTASAQITVSLEQTPPPAPTPDPPPAPTPPTTPDPTPEPPAATPSSGGGGSMPLGLIIGGAFAVFVRRWNMAKRHN